MGVADHYEHTPMCYHTEYGRSTSTAIGISKVEPRTLIIVPKLVILVNNMNKLGDLQKTGAVCLALWIYGHDRPSCNFHFHEVVTLPNLALTAFHETVSVN